MLPTPRLCALALVLVAVLACSGRRDPPVDGGVTAGVDGGLDAGLDAGTDAGLPDAGPAVHVDGTLSFGGRVRTYTLALPPGHDVGPLVPLILALHGGGGNSAQFESTNLLTPKAHAAGFAVVYPNGVGRPLASSIQSWNGGGCCDYAQDQNIDDVGFLRALIVELTSRYRLDPKRVYATGHSNGGVMTYRLGCELADRIAAIAPNASATLLPSCAPSRPLPVLHAHSKLDQAVPYLGGYGSGPGASTVLWPETRSMLDAWATRNTCPAPQTTQHAGYSITRWSGCAQGVAMAWYLSDDGGHGWPGGLPGSAMGDTPTQVFNMNDLLLDFFKQYALP